ncbi:MAG: ABC transporter ATP-binding protein [Gammaproteobacteria bacterium]|nr:ABC transporter ATP-binding protein [Gammaproteobacteria bacterium]
MNTEIDNRIADTEVQARAQLPPLPKLHRQRHPVSKGHVAIEHVTVEFKDNVVAVKEASLDVRPGEFVCLLGPSGCGKSTLLNCVAGFVKPTVGSVKLDGALVVKPGPDRGMVFQQHSLFPWKTVRDNVAFGPLMAKQGKSEAYSIARTLLGMVGLSAYENSYPGVLSGGMKQRVGITRALANYPNVLLMDEPFGALDAQTRAMMQENLLQIWGEFGITVIFVTHDIDEAVFLADRIIVMSASPGQLIADIKVDLPRPRAVEVVSDERYIAAKRRCIDLIRAESLRAFAQQCGDRA